MTHEIRSKGSKRKTLTVWPTEGMPPEPLRQEILQWLILNGIDTQSVALAPITLEFIPGCPGSDILCDGTSAAPWWIALTFHYRNEQGHIEVNALTGEVARIQRTIPLTAEPPLSLVPQWVDQKTYVEADPPPKLARRSQVRQADTEEATE